ncbi:MAG TPA: ABC transporter ATP-binding protein [Methylomirabilota bacterium]|nr:ABC transporter ATP-binding protein [Methylomirabilota bacterium]
MVELRSVTKRFGTVTAVEQVSLRIAAGEFLTLLGPSGCGKTTLLRMISGFETPTEGTVHLDNEDVTHLPPYRRNVNQVFQSYALFPHLTVADNITFGLRMQKLPKSEIARRLKEVTELVSLGGMESRKPAQLSGGQRQRVALARAIVCRPKVLLLDEPLSALDAKLRHAMQIELKRLQRTLGITFVFVTHDQEEALTMSDRIAIVNQGRLEQVASADEIYHAPKTTFVAHFIGKANILPATPIGEEGGLWRIRLAADVELAMEAKPPAAGTEMLLSIRPEKIHLRKTRPSAANVFEARVEEEIFRGPIDELTLRTASGLALTAILTNEGSMQEAIHAGDKVFCHVHPGDIVLVRAG